MACSTNAIALRPRLICRNPLAVACKQYRFHSSSATAPRTVDPQGAQDTSARFSGTTKPESLSGPPLARLSTASILRSLLLSTFFTSPVLFKPGFALFHKIGTSQSPWLNPDRNPVLRAVIYHLVYKQFCAGRNKAEIAMTSAMIRQLGFSGVVLCYGREVQVEEAKFVGYDDSRSSTMAAEISQWANGNLYTLGMVEQGDWLGIK
jgi:hypothetical protein